MLFGEELVKDGGFDEQQMPNKADGEESGKIGLKKQLCTYITQRHISHIITEISKLFVLGISRICSNLFGDGCLMECLFILKISTQTTLLDLH